ncbi:hypothetical protein K503DRAFT_278911 [Rhizopogon vinicolor AM-OR11-026]|uniref:Uncharacterized protein n=1 Tax=Rhizopogon vinicolor AM-OR11-026 TaxID=1314800 RepID=A0A1B7MVY9_9AGAM|nr:hypothetical protein K503DRAFT_278911 [Rhizopogon vinicolor AM-OR11-026]
MTVLVLKENRVLTLDWVQWICPFITYRELGMMGIHRGRCLASMSGIIELTLFGLSSQLHPLSTLLRPLARMASCSLGLKGAS